MAAGHNAQDQQRRGPGKSLGEPAIIQDIRNEQNQERQDYARQEAFRWLARFSSKGPSLSFGGVLPALACRRYHSADTERMMLYRQSAK